MVTWRYLDHYGRCYALMGYEDLLMDIRGA